MKNRLFIVSSILVFVFLSVSFTIQLYQLRKNNDFLMLSTSKAFFNEIILTRLWNSLHGGVYVPITENTQPNPYLDDSTKIITTTDGKRFTKINPAYMTRQIAELTERESKVQFHLTSLNPLRPDNKPDDWEKSAMLEFEKGKESKFELVQFKEKDYYRYIAPLLVESSCLNCHAKQGYKLGEIRGALSVSIDSEKQEASLKNQITLISIIHFFAFVIASILMYIFNDKTEKYYNELKMKNVVLNNEIEEKKKYSALLLQSEKRFKAIIDNSKDLICETDSSGNYLYLSSNYPDVLGYSKEELLSQNIFAFLHPRDLDTVANEFGKDSGTATFRYKCKNASWKWFEASGKRFIFNDNETHIVLVSRDITERKEQEETVEKYIEELHVSRDLMEQQANELAILSENLAASEEQMRNLTATKEKLFSIIAHDLRSPFNALMGLANYIQSEVDDLSKDEIKEFSGNIYQSSKNIYDLLENLLNWSKLQLGKVHFSPERENLKKIVQSVFSLLNSTATQKGVTLQEEISESIEFLLDRMMMETVIRNLVSNAIKFSKPNGIVKILTEISDNVLQIIIVDNGIGIDIHTQAKIFKPEEKVTTLGTNNEKGTGLGLLLCKEFVEKHGGTISFISKLNVGTTFVIKLPNLV